MLLDHAAAARPQLRGYQQKAIDQLFAALDAGKKAPTIVLATGGGKTVIAGEIVCQMALQGKSVIFVVDREDLIGQTADKFDKFGLRYGFIKAGKQESPFEPIQIASWQTLGRRSWWKQRVWDCLIFDEAHGGSAWSNTGKGMLGLFPDAVKIFLTATPWPGGKRLMSQISDHLVLAATPKSLMEQGYLRQQKVFCLPEADLKGVGTKGGDWDEEDLQVVCDRPELIEKACLEWERHAQDRLSLVFCVRQKHARSVFEHFNSRGHKFGLVLGDEALWPDGQEAPRSNLYAAARAGKLQGLIGVGVFTTGFDMPEVGCGLILRPTKSAALHCQILGRLQRPHPTDKRPAIVLDQAGNCCCLGLPWLMPAEAFDLDGAPPKRSKPALGGGPGGKTCPDCHHLCHAAADACPECGYLWPIDDSGKIKQQNDLVEWQLPSVPNIPEFPETWREEIEGLVSASRVQKRDRSWVAKSFLATLGWSLELIESTKALDYLEQRLNFKTGWKYTFRKLICQGKIGNAQDSFAVTSAGLLTTASETPGLPLKLKKALLSPYFAINSKTSTQVRIGIREDADPELRSLLTEHLEEIEEHLASQGFKHKITVQYFTRDGRVKLALPTPAPPISRAKKPQSSDWEEPPF